MAQQIRYASSADGVGIAFTATGSGPPLVLVPSPLLSLILDYNRKPAWYDTLAKQRRLITYDVRGVGASQSAPGPYTVEAALQDLSAVVHAESLASFGIMTFGDGTPIGLAYAARHPEARRSSAGVQRLGPRERQRGRRFARS